MSGARKLHTNNVVLLAFILVLSLFLVVTLIHSVAGDSEVTIGDPFALPATVLWYLEANVMLNVTAVRGVDIVILSYTTNNTNTWQNITMTHVPPGSGQQFENSYEATLPPQTPFTRLTFLVIANDTLGNYAVKNNTAICYIDYEVLEFSVPSFVMVTILIMTGVAALTYAFRRNRLSRSNS
jgi:hypothetical protein